MKNIFKLILLLCLTGSTSVIAADYIDWRKTGTEKEKQKNMIKALPGTSSHMLQVAERYRHLYWAGKLKKWQFANYQIEEIAELLKTVGITRPKRKASADAFLTSAFKLFPAALESKSQLQFNKAFQHMRSECLSCHISNNHSFITLPKAPSRSSSLVFE